MAGTDEMVAGVLTEHYTRWFFVGITEDEATAHFRFSGDDADDEECAEGYTELTMAVHEGLARMDATIMGAEEE